MLKPALVNFYRVVLKVLLKSLSWWCNTRQLPYKIITDGLEVNEYAIFAGPLIYHWIRSLKSLTNVLVWPLCFWKFNIFLILKLKYIFNIIDMFDINHLFQWMLRTRSSIRKMKPKESPFSSAKFPILLYLFY